MGSKRQGGLANCIAFLSHPYIRYSNVRKNSGSAKDRYNPPRKIQEQEAVDQPGSTRAPTLILSLSDARNANGQAQSTNNQAHSLFFKLPFELREQIYRELLGQKGEKDVLHISGTEKRLHHIRCTQRDKPGENRAGWQHDCWNTYMPGCACNEGGKWDHFHTIKPASQNESLLAFLLSCRRVYMEAINLLYTLNTFSVRRDLALVRLAALVPPHRLALIKTLHCAFILDFFTYRRAPDPSTTEYDSWDEAWKIVAGMRGLETLPVSLSQLDAIPHPPTTYQLTSLLAPLSAVKGVKDFSVELLFPAREDLEQKLGEGQFVLRKGKLYEGVRAERRDRSCTLIRM